MGDRLDTVTVQPFCMDLTEVTVDAYASCACSRQCLPAETTVGWPTIAPDTDAKYSVFCNANRPDRGDHPVNCVDWEQSATYCRVLGKRLPTEEEWEWAARGQQGARKYPWGNERPGFQLCWSGAAPRDGTCAVGSFPEGDAPGGIHDLAGNVAEWTSSKGDAGAQLSRGGNWGNESEMPVRSAFRNRFDTTIRSGSVGFRCVR
jgi:sulfatase modifying factor 1